jgi:ubiquinone/menaquinone biosynthesis C-methylase UbiE
MDPRLQQRVQRYGWDKACEHYERYWEAQLRPAQDTLLEMASLRAGEKVLDIACGTGLVTFRASKGSLAPTSLRPWWSSRVG